jgi:DNA repair protein RadC
MHLDSHRRINLVELVAIGTLTDTTIHPRETYGRAVIEGSHSIIVAHNHPLGDVAPSENDITVSGAKFCNFTLGPSAQATSRLRSRVAEMTTKQPT